MPRLSYRRVSATASRWAIWCLLVAVPLCGFSATLSAMLGARHFHRETSGAVVAMEGWQDFRRGNHVSDGTPRVHSHSSHSHSHSNSHGFFERHHHDAGDASVVALDSNGGDSLGSEPGTGLEAASSLAIVSFATIELPLPSMQVVRWPSHAAIDFDSRYGGRLERPPRA